MQIDKIGDFKRIPPPIGYTMDDFVEQSSKVAAMVATLIQKLASPDSDPAAELPLGQLRVCKILQNGPLPASVVGRELQVSLSAVTQIADRLERAQLVKRVNGESDRRIKCLQLTAQAEEIMRRRAELRVERVSRAMENLSLQVRKEVVVALEALVQACELANLPEATLKTTEQAST